MGPAIVMLITRYVLLLSRCKPLVYPTCRDQLKSLYIITNEQLDTEDECTTDVTIL